MKEMIREFIVAQGASQDSATMITTAILLIGLLLLCLIADLFVKKGVVKPLIYIISKTSTSWDDALVEQRVFTRIAHLAPPIVIYALGPAALGEYPALSSLALKLASIYMAVVAVLIFDSILNAVSQIYSSSETSQEIPIKGFMQLLKLITYFIGTIFVISIILSKSPLYLLSGLGALTAVLMLVFKDTILGLVAGIQLIANRMVAVGDWIEMPKFGADGDVLEISLTTVKVQNFDNTITTIPTYALISNSFKNWRGMAESGGRRIKRSINIDISTISLLDESDIERLGKVTLLSDYLGSKMEDIKAHNRDLGLTGTEGINGRRLTNVGTFRAYIEAYLKNHPMINKDLTLLVRQLKPSEAGLPIELYIFTSDKVWVNYEAIQADIFDHILAVAPEFGLRIFQNPTGADLSTLAGGGAEGGAGGVADAEAGTI